ncbi:MAG: polyketide synthase, partial [Candidatus Thiodiazotropha sp.]
MPSRVYISGFSCRFPKANSARSFWNNLINHVDMVSEQSDRWPAGAYGIPKRFGTLQDINKFDASFFEVHPKQAHKMDPQLRKLLEVSYEAILDAGLQPEMLRNKKVGVFIGAHSSDSQCNFSNQPEAMTGYENTGTTLSMLANRLSFYYDFTGPSMTIDTACSSSLTALDVAVTALLDKRCDYALVGGANLILNPAISVGFVRLNMVGEEGVCRSFDEQGKGYARSEGIGALFLTRDDATSRKRARVLATGVNSDGHTSEGITFPNGSAHQRLLEETYLRAGIDIDRIEYIEAHGTGTPAGDPQEVNALSRFTGHRSRPLYIGSVKSNMGHAEGAAGMAGLIKVLLMMEHGEIPANLHFNQANKKITGLHDGTIEVVAKNQAYKGGIVGINSFGFGGTNAHVILEP